MSQQLLYDRGTSTAVVVGFEDDHITQSTVLESQDSLLYDLKLSQDSVIEKYHVSSSQENKDALINLSQCTSTFVKVLAPIDETETTQPVQVHHDHVEDVNTTQSQQTDMYDANPPPLSQDSFSRTYLAGTEEQVVHQCYDVMPPLASQSNSYDNNTSKNWISLPDDSNDYQSVDETKSNNGVGVGVLSQSDCTLMSFGGDIRNVFGSESMLTQELSQLSNESFSQHEIRIKKEPGISSGDAERERKRLEISYSINVSHPETALSNPNTHNPKVEYVSSRSDIPDPSMVSSNLDSLFQAVHLKQQEQQRERQLDRTISEGQTASPKAKRKRGSYSSRIIVKNEEQDTIRPRMKTRKRNGTDETTVPDVYLSVAVSDPNAKRVTPSTTADSVCSTEQSSASTATPPRRGHRGYKKASTSIGNVSPIGPHTEDNTDDFVEEIDGNVLTVQSKKKSNSNKEKATKTQSKDVEDDDCEDDIGGVDNEDYLQIAKEAADLAARALKDQNLASRLLLSLILTREKPGANNKQQTVTCSKYPDAATATADNPYYMPAGFQWCEYPPLEDILKKNRKKYYELSMNPISRQTVEQLSFNNKLVAIIRSSSLKYHWIFYNRKNGDKSGSQDSIIVAHNAHVWTDKALRDRIRFYYKTNKQNALGRLKTMLKNPGKRSNARNLNALYRNQLLSNTSTSSTIANDNQPDADDVEV